RNCVGRRQRARALRRDLLGGAEGHQEDAEGDRFVDGADRSSRRRNRDAWSVARDAHRRHLRESRSRRTITFLPRSDAPFIALTTSSATSSETSTSEKLSAISIAPRLFEVMPDS